VNEHFQALNKGIAKMDYGRILLPSRLAKSPETRFAARAAQKEALDRLEASVTTTMSVHDGSVWVVFIPDGQPIPPKRGFDFGAWLSSQREEKIDGFYAVIGDHTQLVVKKLAGDFPRNVLWQTIPGKLLLCHRSAANYSLLKSWGVADNQKGETRAVTTFMDKVFSIHRDIEEVQARLADSIIDRKAAKTELKRLRSHRGLEFGLNTNSMGQRWGIAQRTGAVWTALEAIISGNVRGSGPKKRFVAPVSAAPFTTMGGIPDDDLAVLLGLVVDGTRTLKEFSESCKRYKATARVQREILAHEDVNVETWLEAQDKFVAACDAQFVSTWVQVILTNNIKQKTPLPGNFSRLLQGKIDHDLARIDNLQEIEQVFYFININSFILFYFILLILIKHL
jgi:hypothetical protein